MALIVRDFVRSVEQVAAGGLGDTAISLLLIQTSQLAAHGARLGALTDVVPEGRYEPDNGREPEVDDLRLSLAEVFAHADNYHTVDDPYFPMPEVVESSLSDDLSSIVTDLLARTRALRRGQVDRGTVVVAVRLSVVVGRGRAQRPGGAAFDDLPPASGSGDPDDLSSSAVRNSTATATYHGVSDRPWKPT